MDHYINLCVMFKFDTENKEPILNTYYNANDIFLFFDQARADINNCKKFTFDETKHFNKFIDFLINCNYPLSKFNTINFVGSNINGIMHYVRLNNIRFSSKNNELICTDKKYDMYINYKPEIFNNKWFKFFPSYFFPYNIYHEKINNGKKYEYQISNIYPSQPKKNNKISLLNVLTITNCFIYAFLYKIRTNPLFFVNLIKNPFNQSTGLLFNGIYYSIVGTFISNIYPNYSNIFFNLLMFYVNLRMY